MIHVSISALLTSLWIGAPLKVLQKAKDTIDNDMIGYTNAMGITPLREAISKHYCDKYNIEVPSKNIVITTGSSAAFLFCFLGK